MKPPKEIFLLHQLLMSLEDRQRQLKKEQDFKEALRVHWIAKGVRQSMEVIKQYHTRIEKPFEK